MSLQHNMACPYDPKVTSPVGHQEKCASQKDVVGLRTGPTGKFTQNSRDRGLLFPCGSQLGEDAVQLVPWIGRRQLPQRWRMCEGPTYAAQKSFMIGELLREDLSLPSVDMTRAGHMASCELYLHS